MKSKTLLQMISITKEFFGVRALSNVNIDVNEGEIHAVVGENGAGKSTLMNVLSGVYPYGSYDGQIIYDDAECRFSKIHDSEKRGIVIIHQELALVPELSIGENMFLGNERTNVTGINWDETYETADRYLKMVGLKESSRTLIKDISVGKQQLVEIAKALAKNVRLLILDEPTASLNEDDSQHLLSLLLEFKQQGMTSILISHKLTEVVQVAERITILRDGETIETLVKGKDDFAETRIIKGMVGRELKDRFPKRTPKIGDISFQVKDWTVYHPVYEDRKVCDNVNIHVRTGEVVGICGLMGSGRTELAMSLFGKSYGRKISGQVFIDGREVKLDSVKNAIKRKIAYVTEDRKSAGLILSAPIRMNTTLSKLEKVSKYNVVIDNDVESRSAAEFTKKLNVKCSGIEQEVVNLSGGNQQKVLLSKWMFAEPDILLLDEPTRGIDVGAKYEIYSIINDLVTENKSVIMISSELPEILGMCDRIYVMNEGKMIGEFTREQASQEAIMASILESSKGA